MDRVVKFIYYNKLSKRIYGHIYYAHDIWITRKELTFINKMIVKGNKVIPKEDKGR